MSNRSSARLKFLLRAAGFPAVGLLGAAAARCIPAARAGLIPTVTLPTASVPSLPVTLPTVPSLPIGTTVTVPSLPIGTTVAVTTPTTTSPGGGGGGGGTPPSGGPGATGSGIVGAVLLSSGLVSVPVSSVTAPARLAIGRITVSPTWIGARRQQVRLVVRVTDSRGYRVRNASVDVRSSPARMIGPSVPARRAPTVRPAWCSGRRRSCRCGLVPS